MKGINEFVKLNDCLFVNISNIHSLEIIDGDHHGHSCVDELNTTKRRSANLWMLNYINCYGEGINHIVESEASLINILKAIGIFNPSDICASELWASNLWAMGDNDQLTKEAKAKKG